MSQERSLDLPFQTPFRLCETAYIRKQDCYSFPILNPYSKMSSDTKSPTHFTDRRANSLPTADTQLTTTETPSVPNKPVVVGIYGIPGSGKTYLLNQLKQKLGEEFYKFYEGSDMIASVVPGGLDAFHKLDEKGKLSWRQDAIDTIGKRSFNSGITAVVGGHFMFWAEEDEIGQRVHTRNDLHTFTHILYLDIPAELVAQRRLSDTTRIRPPVSVIHLQKWQQTEKTELRNLCRQHGILFSLVSSMVLEKTARLLLDFRSHTEEDNLRRAERSLDDIVAGYGSQIPPETVLVMDADRTLAADDTGTMFWKILSTGDNDDPLKPLFSSALGHSYTAFRQATLLYEEGADELEFDAICEEVASSVTMHPEFVSLLKQAAEQTHVAAVIITCGLRLVWDKILVRERLSNVVNVVGGGRIADGFVVTPAVKTALASRCRDTHHMYVLAFGDSQLDLGMLSEAHEAFVVVGEEQTRSKTMETALQNAIDNNGLRACQVLLPPHAPPRMDPTKLPSVKFTDEEFINSILRRRRPASIRIVHATDRTAAKLLMTPTRDARVAGPALRDAHGRIGWYLATEFVTGMIGLEEHTIPHVQGHQTSGHRLRHEQQTTIVALMRGGEPMALGVSNAFPSSMLVHATQPSDVKRHHLQKQHTVLLVDSVVNSGKSVLEFIRHIRRHDATIRIVVVAGVVHSKSLSTGDFCLALEHDTSLGLVALRLSNNKFTGSGITDTGNRLFNTTHLV